MNEYKLFCEDLVKGTKMLVNTFNDLLEALANERELQATADKFEKPLIYTVEKVAV